MVHPEAGGALQQGDSSVPPVPHGKDPDLLSQQRHLSQQEERDSREMPSQRQVPSQALVVFLKPFPPKKPALSYNQPLPHRQFQEKSTILRRPLPPPSSPACL